MEVNQMQSWVSGEMRDGEALFVKWDWDMISIRPTLALSILDKVGKEESYCKDGGRLWYKQKVSVFKVSTTH